MEKQSQDQKGKSKSDVQDDTVNTRTVGGQIRKENDDNETAAEVQRQTDSIPGNQTDQPFTEDSDSGRSQC